MIVGFFKGIAVKTLTRQLDEIDQMRGEAKERIAQAVADRSAAMAELRGELEELGGLARRLSA